MVSTGAGAETLVLGNSAARNSRRSEILVDGILGSFADTLLITLGLAATIQMLPTKSLLTLVALSIPGLT